MEVVLLENIKNLGQIGDIVKVKRGHGRNFLIKYGKALKASKINIDFVWTFPSRRPCSSPGSESDSYHCWIHGHFWQRL